MVRSDGRQDDRLESLELEFNLLKTEIRQTLIDVKEYVMKGRSVNPPARPQAPPPPPEIPTNEVVVEPTPVDYGAEANAAWEPSDPPATSSWEPRPEVKENALAPTSLNDSTMMKNIIWWLGTARRRGITLGQLSPFIEAYEMSGYMSPLVSKLIYKTMAHLADEEAAPTNQQMPQDFSDGLMQLNEIITTPGFDIQEKTLSPDQLGAGGVPPTSFESDDNWEQISRI